MHETPPFGDLEGMTEWASYADDFAELGIAELIQRGALQALSDDHRREAVLDDFVAPDERQSKPDDETMANLLGEIDYVAHGLMYMWGRCALRLLMFAQRVPDTWENRFVSRHGLANVTWYLDGCDWLLSLVKAANDASDAVAASVCRLTPGELAGAEGSTFSAVSAEHRAESARIIAQQTLRSWWVVDVMAEQVERLYRAYYAFCCRTEVLARCASEHPDDPVLGALFGLLVASAISVVGELETTEAQRILLYRYAT